MRTVKTINTVKVLLIMTSLAAVMSSCVLNEGDPQTTLCQKLTAHLMTAEKVTWNKATKVSIPNENLQITVGFNNKDGSVTEATCTYGLNDRDEGEDYEINPDEFVNIPDSMVINGQEVRLQDLHTSIQKVTGQAVKDTLSEKNIIKKANEATDIVKETAVSATENLKKGAEQAKEAVSSVADSATESLKEGAEQAKDTVEKVADQLKEKTKDLQHKAGEVLEKAGEKLQE